MGKGKKKKVAKTAKKNSDQSASGRASFLVKDRQNSIQNKITNDKVKSASKKIERKSIAAEISIQSREEQRREKRLQEKNMYERIAGKKKHKEALQREIESTRILPPMFVYKGSAQSTGTLASQRQVQNNISAELDELCDEDELENANASSSASDQYIGHQDYVKPVEKKSSNIFEALAEEEAPKVHIALPTFQYRGNNVNNDYDSDDL